MFTRGLFFLAACAATFLVFVLSAAFYTSAAGDNVLAWRLYVAIAAVSGFVKVLFPIALSYLQTSKPAKVAAWVAIVCCIVFDSLGVSGFVTMTRGAGVEAKKGDANGYWATHGEVQRLRGLADEMKATRPTGIIRAELQNAKSAAPNCTLRPNAATELCVKLGNLEVEAATADERDKRESEWKTARDKLNLLPRPNDAAANPLAKGVAPFVRWLNIDAETAADLVLRGVLVVLLEMVPSLCSYFATRTPRQSPAPKVPEGDQRPPAATGSGQRRQAAPREPPPDLLTLLQRIMAGQLQAPGIVLSGDGVMTSNRALAKVAATSPTSVNLGLQALATSGRIQTTSSPKGTHIRLT